MAQEGLQHGSENIADKTSELQSKVLQLEGPVWSYGGNRYEATKMGITIVDFLRELKESEIDRKTNPEVARFVTQRTELSPESPLALQELFNNAVSTNILREATARGIDVAIIKGRLHKDNSPYASRADKFEPPAMTRTSGLSDRIKAFLGKTQPDASVVIPHDPDFLLKFTLDFHGPETQDYQKDTWSYKELLHKIEIVDPQAEPVTYMYYPYETT